MGTVRYGTDAISADDSHSPCVPHLHDAASRTADSRYSYRDYLSTVILFYIHHHHHQSQASFSDILLLLTIIFFGGYLYKRDGDIIMGKGP